MITLTTDFGTQDGYVGAMKGQILSTAPSINIVDITHDCPPQNLYHAAAIINQFLPHFPADTIHVVVVDPGVGTDRAILVARVRQQWLLLPDNGILSLLDFTADEIRSLNPITSDWSPSNTFDGLSTFAPAAAKLAVNKQLQAESEITSKTVTLPRLIAKRHGDLISGHITHIDHFGNMMTNIPANWAELNAQFTVSPIDVTLPVKTNYSAVSIGHNALIVNAHGLLELSTRCGSFHDQCTTTPNLPFAITLNKYTCAD